MIRGVGLKFSVPFRLQVIRVAEIAVSVLVTQVIQAEFLVLRPSSAAFHVQKEDIRSMGDSYCGIDCHGGVPAVTAAHGTILQPVDQVLFQPAGARTQEDAVQCRAAVALRRSRVEVRRLLPPTVVIVAVAARWAKTQKKFREGKL